MQAAANNPVFSITWQKSKVKIENAEKSTTYYFGASF
jgi:hypothetical protein